MHAMFQKASGLTEQIIGAAIEVHRHMGPGLLESVYEWCFTCELELRGLAYENQREVRIRYKHFQRDEVLRFDVLVERCVLVEIKAVERVIPLNKAQLLSYMKLLDCPIGLLINFNVPRLTQGVSRLILPGANR